jgi:hypothetical protein
MGTRVLKLMVILLCTMNAAIWQMYTESPFMAAAWGLTAVAFVGWIIYDMRA